MTRRKLLFGAAVAGAMPAASAPPKKTEDQVIRVGSATVRTSSEGVSIESDGAVLFLAAEEVETCQA